ncbi:hypothetical protein T484DRAFT_1639909 [Baffinella frigidus]|nr:hypothetical protein T484DRAFT_1639909 [Cryptophyta sp. CCMP2293]
MYLCIYVSVYLCIYVSMYLCIYTSMYLYIYVSMYLCIYESIYQHPCIYISIHPSIYLSMRVIVEISLSLSLSLWCGEHRARDIREADAVEPRRVQRAQLRVRLILRIDHEVQAPRDTRRRPEVDHGRVRVWFRVSGLGFGVEGSRRPD